MTEAGFYHCSVKSVGRANGRSIVAAAAYRSGERLEDEITGTVADYRARGGVVETFIMCDWTQDRAQLWNGAEHAEHRANGRLATELELALPHELPADTRKRLLQDFLAPILAEYGVAADVAIHEPGVGKDHRNIHAHVLITNRKVDANGFVEKVKGQRKDIGLSGFAMGSEAVIEIRKSWEQYVNRACEQAGLDIRVDHRSHKERGIPQEPTKHLGPAANAMEDRGVGSDRGDINRQIEADNAALRDRAQQEIEAIKAAADHDAAAMLESMERTGVAPPIHFDRDAAEAAWLDAVVNAAIAADAARAEQPAQQTAKGRLEDIRPEFEDGDLQPSRAAQRRAARQSEHDEMDEDIAAKQREQRQQIEDKEAATYNDEVAQQNRIGRFRQEWQISHDHGERNRKSLQEQLYARDIEDGITDVRVRAILAAGESRDFVQAVRTEGAMITREHLDLQRDIALEQDPDKKQMLEFRRDIQHADYMALANERVAAMSNLNSEQYKEAMRQQEEWQKTGTELRKERLELQDRMADREAAEINAKVEAHVEQLNRAARHREEYRSDIRGPAAQDHQPTLEQRAQQGAYAGARGRRDEIGPLPETAREAVQGQYAAGQASAPGQAERPISEPERPAEVAYSTPARPLEQEAAAETTARENSDARQVESTTAEHTEITDAKARAKAVIAQQRGETEQSIASGLDRGNEYSR